MGGLRMRMLFLLAGLALCSASSVSNKGYQQWHVNEIADHQVDDIRKIIKGFNLDILSSGKDSVDILVDATKQKILGRTLAQQGFHYEVQIDNLQSLIDEEKRRLNQRQPSAGINITDFNDFETIEAYVKELADDYEWVTYEYIGTTIEGRALLVNKLAVPSKEPKPTVWIDCGIHAREWLSHSTCIYGLDHLTKGYSTVTEVTEFLDKYDLYIMPVYNPDGYSYTWTDDRYWRKNRMETNVPECPGVDLNRNCDDGHWDGPYSGDWECDTDYRGSSPFSELETLSVKTFIDNLPNKPIAYFNIHTYSELWMYAYGFTSELPKEHEELERVTKIGVDALESVHGTHYDYGPVYTTIYPVNGDALDWAYVNGIVYSYVMELRGPSFVVPPSEIVPTGEETWCGIMALLMAI